MKRILLFLLPFATFASDTPVVVVRGTNVLGTAVIEPSRFTPPAGASNVTVTAAEVGLYGKGWTYSGGVFRDAAGQPLSNGLATWLNREKLIDAALATCDDIQSKGATADANWATLTAAQKDAYARGVMNALVKVSEIVELLVKQQRALLQAEKPE